MATSRPQPLSEGRSLLQAVSDDPENDTPRLIYADWLEEQGQGDQAEFIRLQCTLAKSEEEDPERLPLQRREWELLDRHRKEWTPPFAKVIDAFAFQRGFVSQVTMSLAKFAAHGRAMFRKAPTVHSVTLNNLDRQGQRLLECEHLAWVTPVVFPEVFARDWIDGLLDCPHLTRLTHLTLPVMPSPMPAEQARRLRTWPALGSLRSLDLLGDPLDLEELQPLASSPLLANLHTLALGYPPRFASVKIQERGVQALMSSPHLRQLRELHLRKVLLREDGVSALVRSPHTPRLEKLVVSSCRLGPTPAGPLFRSEALRGVRYLSLWGNRLEDEGAALLAGCALPSLRFLNLGSTDLGPEGVRALARSGNLEQLTGLDLSGNDLGSEGLKELLSASFLPNLRYLNLSEIGLQAGDLKALAACPALANVRELDLSLNVDLGDEDVKALAGSPHLSNLLSLDLNNSVGTGGGGLEALFRSPVVKNLLVLTLSSSAREAPGADDAFFASPLPDQLLRLRFYGWPTPNVPDRYREELGDRLVLTSPLG